MACSSRFHPSRLRFLFMPKRRYVLVGRPPTYATPEEFSAKAVEYFEKKTEAKWTITGLALHLGFSDRQSLYDYEEKPEFTCIVKQCRLMVEMAYEQKLSSINVTGAIFALKNMGWTDKTEIKQEVKIDRTDYANLDDDEIAQMIALQRKAVGE